MGAITRDRLGNYRQCNYQDVWVRGELTLQGPRECALRFDAIRRYLKKFKRPIKVLDIGANMGYFSFRLSECFEGCYVMVEGGPTISRTLLKICQLNQNPQMILLRHFLSLDDLRKLASVEQFDVVLALSVVHHFEEPYQEVFDTLRSLGHVLIFELPVPEEHTYNQHRIIREPIDLTFYKKKTLVAVKNGSKHSCYKRETCAMLCDRPPPSHAYWDASEPYESRLESKVDFYTHEYFYPHLQQTFKPNPGISLSTFLGMNGLYPTPHMLITRLKSQRNWKLDDLGPENIWLTGSECHLRPECPTKLSSQSLADCIVKWREPVACSGLF